MRRLISLTLLTFGVVSTLSSQNIVPFKKEGKDKWGYRDSVTLEEVYSPKLQQADRFENGCARVMQKNKYGILNQQGEFVVKPIYSNMELAPDNRYKVYNAKSRAWGYISRTTGEEVIPVKYSSIGSFTLESDSLAEAIITNGVIDSYGYISWSGEERIPVKYAFIGTFDKDGCTWANYLGAAGDNGTVYKGYHTVVSRKYGVLIPDETYFKLISPVEVRELDQAAKSVAAYDDEVYNSPIEIFKSDYTSVYDRELGSSMYKDKDGYYFFTKSYENKAGVITKYGKEVIPAGKFFRVSIPVGDYAMVSNFDLDKSEFNYFIYNIKTGIATPVVGGLSGAIVDGVVLMARFDRGGSTGKEIINTRFRYYNMDAKLLGFDYTEARKFSNGLGVCSKGDAWGAIDKDGDVVIPFNYKYLGEFDHKGYLMARNSEDKVGFIDKAQNILIPFEYSKGSDFKESRAKMFKGLECGVIDYNNNIVIDFQWRDILLPVVKESKIAWVCDNEYKWHRYDMATSTVDSTLSVDKIIRQNMAGFTVVNNGVQYAIIADNDGSFLMPFETFESEEKVYEIYNYYKNLGYDNVEKIDIVRYAIRERMREAENSVYSVIDEADWDY